jgi:hypothetical protein
MCRVRVLGAGLFIIAGGAVLFGVLVAVTAPSGGEAPRWVHILSAVPLFIAALFLAALGSFCRRGWPKRR